VEFTRGLVHELKTPLTSVIASSELLALELPDGPLLRMTKNINRSAENLNERINELLDVARGELGMLKLSLTAVDPSRLLRELAEDMGPVASKQHQSLVLDLPPVLLPVWADENRLRQVVLNLLSNACKFTGEGGKIILGAREEGERLIVEVEDTGPGLSEAEQQRLFTRYYRGEGDRERFSGLGLGLALCKTLVELHKGQIWVRSQPGKGSTFGFSVPLATASQRGEVAEGEEEE
jgi:signal transduction histidine kinase